MCVCFWLKGQLSPKNLPNIEATCDYSVVNSGVEGKFTEQFNCILEKMELENIALMKSWLHCSKCGFNLIDYSGVSFESILLLL